MTEKRSGHPHGFTFDDETEAALDWLREQTDISAVKLVKKAVLDYARKQGYSHSRPVEDILPGLNVALKRQRDIEQDERLRLLLEPASAPPPISALPEGTITARQAADRLLAEYAPDQRKAVFQGLIARGEIAWVKLDGTNTHYVLLADVERLIEAREQEAGEA